MRIRQTSAVAFSTFLLGSQLWGANAFVTDRMVHDIPDKHRPASRFLEILPSALTWPAKPIARKLEQVLHAEHDHVETELSDIPIGIQPVPDRPNLLLEWNERFLGPGFLSPGIEFPGGAVWRPALWVFGQYRSAYQYVDIEQPGATVSEWANRLDLFCQLNLSGTERVMIGLRPLDQERDDRRDYSGYDFKDGAWTDGWNGDVQTLFFEGDFGELLPLLDPLDARMLDYAFSVGRMPLLAQQGLLINEDRIDAVTATRNTLSGHGILNLRASAVYAWNSINRNSPTTETNRFDTHSRMIALLTESDTRHATWNLDTAFVNGSNTSSDLLAFGLSATKRYHGLENTYNLSTHILASYPTNDRTPFADQGELLFSRISWTPHHTYDLIYVNCFWAIDQFTAPARGPLRSTPLEETGLLFASSGLGRLPAPISTKANDVAGAVVGYQFFFDDTRSQFVWELGGVSPTKERGRHGTIGTLLRVQRAIGQNFVVTFDGFVVETESTENVTPGARSELLVKF